MPDPAPEAVYQTDATAQSGAGNQLSYLLPVADGTYTIRLLFAEPSYYFNVGDRVFDIELQGQVVQAGFDIVAAAGGNLRATELSFSVTASGGSGISLNLVNDTYNPAVLAGIALTQNNAGGVAAPTASVQLSTDGGTTWGTLATGVPIAADGTGSFSWTPTAGEVGLADLIRVVADQGDPTSGISAPFTVAPDVHDFYINDTSTVGDSITSAIGNNANTGTDPAHPMADLVRCFTITSSSPATSSTSTPALMRYPAISSWDSAFIRHDRRAVELRRSGHPRSQQFVGRFLRL